MNVTNATSAEWDSIQLVHFVTKEILYFIAFVGNLLTMIVIYRFPALRRLNNATIISLAASDMLVGLIGFIVNAMQFKPSLLPYTVRLYVQEVFNVLYGVAIYSSLFHLVVLSIDRSIAIFLPLRYAAIVNKAFIKILLTTTLILASAFSLTNTLLRLRYTSQQSRGIYLLFIIVFNYVLFFSILTSLSITSITILLLVRDKRRVLPGQQARIEHKTGINKATKRISLILLTYIFTNAPGCLASFVYLDAHKYLYFIINVTPFLSNVIIMNSCFNIVIYSTTSNAFRSAYVKQIKCFYQDLVM